MMNLKDAKKDLKDLITNGQVRMLFQSIPDRIKSGCEIYEEFETQRKNWQDVKKGKRRKRITQEEYQIEINNINNFLLDIIEDIEDIDLLYSESYSLLEVLTKLRNNEEVEGWEQTKKRYNDVVFGNGTFRNCEFYKCEFENVVFKNVKFIDCDFKSVKFINTIFYATEFNSCVIDAKFKSNFAIINASAFRDSKLWRSSFSEGQIIDTDFSKSELRLVTMMDVLVQKPNFTDTDLAQATLNIGDFTKKDFIRCKSLRDTNLPIELLSKIAHDNVLSKLLSYEQLRELNPNHKIVIETEKRNAEMEEELAQYKEETTE